MTPFPARFGLWSAVAARRSRRLRPDPVRSGTVGGHSRRRCARTPSGPRARCSWKTRIGSLEPGKHADIAVWDKNLYEIPTEELETIQCQMTLFQGEVVFER